MGIAFVPLYIRYIGIEAYGLIGVFAILQSSLAILDLGMKPTLGREMARFAAGAHNPDAIRNLLRSIEIISALTAVLIAVAVWLASFRLAADWIVSKNLPDNEVTRAFSAMGVVIALRFVESIYVSSMVGLQRQVIESVVGSSMATIRATGALAVLALISPTVEAFFIWQAVVSFMTIPILACVVYRQLPVTGTRARFSRAAIMGVWRFAGGVMLITLLALLLTQVDKILLSRLLPLKVFACYALAGVLTNALYVLTGPITAAFYPQFTELATRQDMLGLRRAYHQAAQLTTVAVGGASMVLMVFADAVLRVWTGNPGLSTQVAPLLKVLALGTMVNALLGVPYQMQLAHGWTTLTIKTNIVAVAIFIPAAFYVVPVFGALGAAWLWFVLNLGYLVVSIYFMHRRLLRTEKWRWYGQDVALPLAVAAATAVTCRHIMPQDASKPVAITLILLSSCLTALLAASSCPLVRTPLARYVQRFMRRGARL